MKDFYFSGMIVCCCVVICSLGLLNYKLNTINDSLQEVRDNLPAYSCTNLGDN